MATLVMPLQNTWSNCHLNTLGLWLMRKRLRKKKITVLVYLGYPLPLLE